MFCLPSLLKYVEFFYSVCSKNQFLSKCSVFSASLPSRVKMKSHPLLSNMSFCFLLKILSYFPFFFNTIISSQWLFQDRPCTTGVFFIKKSYACCQCVAILWFHSTSLFNDFLCKIYAILQFRFPLAAHSISGPYITRYNIGGIFRIWGFLFLILFVAIIL